MNQDSIRKITQEYRQGKSSLASRVAKQAQIIALKNPSLCALAYYNQTNATLRAQEIDQLRNSRSGTGRLFGTTFSTRLSIEVAGMPYSTGSLSEELTISMESCQTVTLLEEQGALCIGKGNIAERGKSYYSDNPRYGRTNHFIDQTLSPGGSGGGDAVAVACAMVDFAIGADAGGSVRVPANFCGLYGLSSTPGSLSESSPLHASTAILKLFKSLGIITRTLDDLEIIHSVVEKFDALDPSSSSSFIPYRKPRNRFLIIEALNGVRPADEITQALHLAAKRLTALGYVQTPLQTQLFDQLIEPYIILAAQAQLLSEDAIASQNGKPLQKQQEGPHIQALRSRIATELKPLSAEDLLLRWHQLDSARIQVARLFNDIDFIIAPVSATLPVAHNTARYLINGASYTTELVFQFASLTNALGLPAIAVPTQPTAQGIPVGFQIIGPRFSERELFSILRKGQF
jgi:amidase